MSYIGPRRALLGASIDTDASKWRSAVLAAGGSVSDAQKRRVSTIIRSLKSASVWSTLDRLWLFAAENSTQALIDLVSRSTATAVNSPTFAAMQGYAGNGISSYVDSGYNLSTATNYKQNSGHVGVWRRVANSSGGNGNDGVISTTGSTNGTFTQFGASATSVWINSTASGNVISATVGHLIGSRTASALTATYLNGSANGTDTTASVVPLNLTYWIGGRNFVGSINQPGNYQTFVFHAGAALSAAQALAMFNALNAYKTAVGA
jgi:hypothetical protein